MHKYVIIYTKMLIVVVYKGKTRNKPKMGILYKIFNAIPELDNH